MVLVHVTSTITRGGQSGSTPCLHARTGCLADPTVALRGIVEARVVLACESNLVLEPSCAPLADSSCGGVRPLVWIRDLREEDQAICSKGRGSLCAPRRIGSLPLAPLLLVVQRRRGCPACRWRYLRPRHGQLRLHLGSRV